MPEHRHVILVSVLQVNKGHYAVKLQPDVLDHYFQGQAFGFLCLTLTPKWLELEAYILAYTYIYIYIYIYIYLYIYVYIYIYIYIYI